MFHCSSAQDGQLNSLRSELSEYKSKITESEKKIEELLRQVQQLKDQNALLKAQRGMDTIETDGLPHRPSVNHKSGLAS